MNGIRRHAARTHEERNTQKFHLKNLKTAGVDGRVILVLKWVLKEAVNCFYYVGWVKDERISVKRWWTDIHRGKIQVLRLKKKKLSICYFVTTDYTRTGLGLNLGLHLEDRLVKATACHGSHMHQTQKGKSVH